MDLKSAVNAPPDELRHWERSLAAEVEVMKTEIRSLSALLNKAEEKLALVRRLLELTDAADDTGSPEGLFSAPENSQPQTTRFVEDAVEEFLQGVGKPTHISFIREALVDQGFPIPGRGDDANIIVRLRQYPERFTRTARGTYALASWGLPEMKPKRRRPSKRVAG